MFETSEPIIEIDFIDNKKVATLPQDEADGAECFDDYDDLVSKRITLTSAADVSNNSTKTQSKMTS